MKECEHLKGRKKSICDGSSGLPLSVVNKYRVRWGMEPTDQVAVSKNLEDASSVGTKLHEVIFRETGIEIPCAVCKKEIAALNKLTSEEAMGEKDRIVESIYSRSWENAVRLSDKMKLIADKIAVSSTSILPKGKQWTPAKKIIGQWFDEAVVNGHEPERKKVVEIKKPHRPRQGRHVAGGGGNFASSFKNVNEPIFVSSCKFQEDIKLLIAKIPSDITAIAGVARSGLSAATMISMYLHLPMFTIRQTLNDIQPTGNGWRLGGTRHVSPENHHVLVVDDTVMTGNSLKAISPLLNEKFKKFTLAAVYVNPLAKKKPDIYAMDLSWPHLLEWNLFNSVLSPNMACDFDGILCRDCPIGSDDDGPKYLNFIKNAKPLYTPRKVPIPLIVTARIEKYREPTLEWLDKYNIKVKKLVMHPAKTLAERQKDDISVFKATHFKKWAKRHKPFPPPLGFIESDDNQAKKIARLTKLMVICPSTARVY